MVATVESNTIQLAITSKGNTINMSSTNKTMVFKGVNDNGNGFYDDGIINPNSVRFRKAKLDKFKNLI